jgi:hypothetical protein
MKYSFSNLRLAIPFLVVLTGIASPSWAEIVQGTVLEDHSGAPLPTASVRIKSSAGTVIKELDTDRSGQFVARDLAAGEYLVSVSKANYAPISARMTAQPDATSLPILRLIKYGIMSGHLTSPRTGGTVTAIEEVPAGKSPRSYSGTVEAAGNFRIFGIAPGRYQLSAPLTAATLPTVPRGIAFYPSNAKPREFVITGGEEYNALEFTVPADGMSTISGKVTGPGTPQIFTLSLIESEHPSIRLMAALTASTEDGTFHFDSILPGTYDLYATGPLTPPTLFAHIRLVLNGQKIENMDIVLKPGRPVEVAMSAGKATASNSPCSPNGVLTLQAIGTWAPVRDLKFTAPISPTTPARIENVAPGPFTVTAQSSTGNCFGVTTALLDLRNDSTPERITVLFQPLGSIHGNAAAGSVVVLRDMTPGRESTQAVFPPSGSPYRFDGLAPGQYCVATQCATDTIPHWSPEAGCPNPIVNLAPGESKAL